ncbi:MAG TPA: hypothetical protein VF147_08045, partial [Vicinamibacterales bacterium]
YDQQSISLFDVIARGIVAPDNGTGTGVTTRGKYSRVNTALDLGACARLVGQLPSEYVDRMRTAFTTGYVAPLGDTAACNDVGGEHENAIGYATIDVVANCAEHGPEDPAYWTEDLAYDNVFAGDYQQVHVARGIAQGGPLVHIRAIPEGGTAATRRVVRAKYEAGFPRTFYARFQPADAPALDGRQPLPSTFAARWLNQGSHATTYLKIWREPKKSSTCAELTPSAWTGFREIVVFDEEENANAERPHSWIPSPHIDPVLPSTSRTAITDSTFYPQMLNAGGGWIYLNLDAESDDGIATQNWVMSSTHIDERSTDVDATALGNGCSAPARTSEVTRAYGPAIGPAPNVAASSGQARATIDNDDSCDIAQLPAATLLLPYFEVDFENPGAETTVFTITNVGPREQIARVTLWTDYAVPVISFNIYLTGYDVQAINLYDVIGHGWIAPDRGTGTAVSHRGRYSDRNRDLSPSNCDRLPGALSDMDAERIQSALTEGTAPECNNIGNVHDHAVGYATVDVVGNCSSNTPADPAYWTSDIRWDNVLTGDWVQENAQSSYGGPMVHIRAVPDGGTLSERRQDPASFDAGFPRTFYARYQPAGFAKFDGRQPLPSAFSAHWTTGSGVQTAFNIWRESTAGVQDCAHHDNAGVPRAFEVVRFDDRENAVSDFPISRVEPMPVDYRMPSTARVHASDTSVFPQLVNGATSGWIYLNLDSEAQGAGQNWIVTTMQSQNMAVAFDANALGNGCSAAAAESEVKTGTAVIGPLP